MRMSKMLRSRKNFGRCRVPGHGQSHIDTDHFHRCEVVDEIQSQPFTRCQDKREWKKEIEIEITE